MLYGRFRMLNQSPLKIFSSNLFTIVFFFTALLTIFIFTSCQRPLGKDASEGWVGTWGTAPQLVEPGNMPPKPGLSNNTLRQVVHVSIGGERIQVKFSNEYGKSPVTLKSVHIALSEGNGVIDPATDKAILFNGKAECTMAPGLAVTSDQIDFAFKPRTDLAITILYGDTPTEVTGHPGSRTTSYIVTGNKVSETELKGAVTTDHWYTISGIDVMKTESSAAAVVILGNSITDGRGSGTNKQNRWPDELARRLQENPSTQQVAVLNMGIGGNCVLRNGLGPYALSRFDRDVIKQNGARWLIIFEGINDIGGSKGKEGAATVAQELIKAYEKMIDIAHAKGMRVYGATILPFGTSFYDAPEHQDAWKTVNEWIRTSGRFDAVIDLAAAMKETTDPTRLLPAADTGDHLHPNELGYRMMAEAVDLKLFE